MAIGASYVVANNGLIVFFKGFVWNILFNTAIIIILISYYYLKTKKLNAIKEAIGLGDVLFLTVLSCLFSPVNYAVFFVISTFLSSIIAVLMILFKQSKQIKIPLAGIFSVIAFIILIVNKLTLQLNLFDDSTVMYYFLK